jgi:hypothetical protein
MSKEKIKAEKEKQAAETTKEPNKADQEEK